MTPNRPTDIDAPERSPRLANRRIKITLPAILADKLAHRAGEPPAKVAAQIIRQAIDNDHPSPSTRDNDTRSDDERGYDDNRAPWLELYGGSREWRGLTWVGLHACYPHVLSSLKDDWWHNATHLETLSALAYWHQWIDDAGRDPREEVAFQIQLADYGRVLRQEGGGVADAWELGAPPIDW
jgi:hypothetical protein